MIQKLFNHILATCLLFGSLYLPAHAGTANKTPAAAPTAALKKSPETSYLEGENCLKQGNIQCARLALAGIPSGSAYAKLLQGNIALYEKQTDQALLLLLPLQTETTLIPQAKAALHLQIAAAFAALEDTAQAMLHLIEAESIMTASNLKELAADTNGVHQKIWALLSKLEQSELIELRGNNTDNTFQGWIDLRLAAKNQSPDSSIPGWSLLYPDHPAQAFAKNLSESNPESSDAQSALASAGSIALIVPLSVEAYSAMADAFQRGLQAALTEHGLHNEIKTYPTTANPLDIDAAHTLAKSEGHAYFIMPNFDTGKIADNRIAQSAESRTLHIGHTLDDESQHIARFALSSGMQKITVITSDNAASKAMAARFEAAWNKLTKHENSNVIINSITLPANISNADSKLPELKSQLTEKMPDMVLLAMLGPEARLVRPHIPIGTPVMTFSSAHEAINDTSSYQALNAVRLFEMPYLLEADQNNDLDHETKDNTPNSKELKRWFALGSDSLQLLIASEHMQEDAITVNGLSGTLTILPSGLIKRELPLAILTDSGIAPE